MDKHEQDHSARILDQFTRQAQPFARLAAHSHPDAMRLIVASARLTPTDSVLDVACGPGLLTCELAKHAKQVTGVDLVPAMLERARYEQQQRGLHNVSFEIGNARALDFAAASFDKVLSRFSFHHLSEPRLTLEEMKRVCRPGGVVTVIDVTPEPDKRAAYDGMELLRDPSHTSALTELELSALFTSAGFVELRHQRFELEMELERQLAASFPQPGDADRIRTLFRADVTNKDNKLGVQANERDGQIYFVYACSIFSAQRT